MKNENALASIRDSRYELIRIVAMLMIIASHCIKLLLGTQYEFLNGLPSLNYCAAFTVIMFGNVGTYLFIILTCWFSIGKINFKANRITKMLWQTYTICILCIFISLLFLHSLDTEHIIRELITPFDTQYWFVTTMIVFTFFLPLLQTLDEKLDNNKLKAICIVLIIIRPVRVIYSTELIGDLGDFIMVFFIASYLKRNPDNWFKKNAKTGVLIFTIIVALLLIFRYIMPDELFGFELYNNVNGGIYHSVIAKLRVRTFMQLFCAICLFYLFLKIKIKPNRVINFIAKYNFGVYLWHFNYATRSFILNKIFCLNYFYTNTNIFTIVIIIVPVVIYLLCTLLEFVRGRIFDNWLYEKLPWNKKIENKIDNLYNWK